ncbi:MAG: lytic transglycosylase domain-containing protein [Alphaproteobacteria bacterium]
MLVRIASKARSASASLVRTLALRGALCLVLSFGAFLLLATHAPRTSDAARAAAALPSPDYMSERDRRLYQDIYALQARGDSEGADAAIAQLTNPVLLGHVLAARYLGAPEKATRAELTDWLARYADHPEAKEIRALALRRGADAKTIAALNIESDRLRGDGAIPQVGGGTMPDGWYHGLSLWRAQNYKAAAESFAGIGDNESLEAWQRAAGDYWAWRSYSRLDENGDAERALADAARYPTTFYGLLALRQRGDWPKLAARAPAVPDAVRANPHAVRARALTAIGRSDDAEDELRQLYAELDPRDRPAIVTLAGEIDLANLEVRLARLPQLSQEEAIFAAYPMPAFAQTASASIDPALVLAIARQESGFREEARNGSSGALGMMQMLPSTAQGVLRNLRAGGVAFASASDMSVREQLADPERSFRLGAEYVKLLEREPAVGNNLIKILAAYNAGPGAVAGWQAEARNVTDPLLYLESIPYGETRSYVMEVAAHYWVYATLMGKHPQSLAAMAQGDWPKV